MDPLSTLVAAELAAQAKRTGRKWAPFAIVLAAALIALAALVAAGSGIPTPPTSLFAAGTVAADAAVCGVQLPAAPSGTTAAGLTAEQQANARAIISVGQAKGVPTRGSVVAIATAMQESRLKNLTGGDRDSVGLFQQRPSQGWGTVTQLTTPTYAAGKFFDALLAVPKWQTLPVTVAAQKVQRSAFPNAYAQWESLATSTVSSLLGGVTVAAPDTCATAPTAAPAGASIGVIAAARKWVDLATPYSWGGGTLAGPSRGTGVGATTVGFDCSSFARWAYYHGAGITLPRTSVEQYTFTASRTVTTTYNLAALKPGDLLFYGSSANAIHHVAMYAGNGLTVQEPKTGGHAEIVPTYKGDFYAATRPLGA